MDRLGILEIGGTNMVFIKNPDAPSDKKIRELQEYRKKYRIWARQESMRLTGKPDPW